MEKICGKHEFRKKPSHIRYRKRLQSFPIFVGICSIFMLCFIVYSLGYHHIKSRHLTEQELTGCALNSETESYPPDLILTWPYCQSAHQYGVILHFVGMLFMFYGLAIVCDVYFVSALEEICVRWKLQEDVAGATFMAAGGSAPEFFTNLLAVFFTQSDVGIGTIVGSAVFNVLFVIAACAVFAGAPLELTWWPLFRDCIYYIFSLCILVGFMYDEKIYHWEAAILFFLYIVYVTMMKYNADLNAYFSARVPWEKHDPVREKYDSAAAELLEKNSHQSPCSGKNGKSPRNKTKVLPVDNLVSPIESDCKPQSSARKTFAAEAPDNSSLSSLKSVDSIESGVPEINSETDLLEPRVFQRRRSSVSVVQRKSLKLGESDIKKLQQAQEKFRSSNVAKSSPNSRNGSVDKTNNIPSSNPEDPKAFLTKKNTNQEDDQVHTMDDNTNPIIKASAPINGHADQECKSVDLADQEMQMDKRSEDTQENMDEDEDEDPMAWPSDGSNTQKVLFCLGFPVVAVLHYTIPDCTTDRFKDFYWITFFLSLVWITIFSYFMVWWAIMIAEVIRLPSTVMGLTVIAAGTSIPDALSSVAVAMKGFGDMAVSSSIGSNIFDILVGLPVPWLIYTIAYSTQQTIKSSGLVVSIITLILMVLLVVLSIVYTGWVLGKKLGCIMIGLYVLFLMESILLEML